MAVQKQGTNGHAAAPPVTDDQLYLSMAENFPSGLYVYYLEDPADPLSLRLTFANAATRSATGLVPAQVVGKRIGEAFPNLVNTAIPSLYQRIALGGEKTELGEITYSDDQIAPSTYRVTAFPITARRVGVLFDNLTEQKVLASKRQEAENLYRAFAANFPNGALVLFDHDLRYRLVDGAGLAEVGLNKHEMEGKTIYEIFPPEVASAIEGPYKAALNGQRVVFETPFANRTYQVTNTPIYDEAGAVVYALTMTQDVTQRKQAEAEARKRAAELQTVAEIAQAASTIRDTERLLQDVVNLTKERFGLYHAHIYQLNEAGDQLVVTAGAGEAGRLMKERGHSIPLDKAHSLVARAARTREGVIVNNVQAEPDFLPNPLLPDTRAEMAVPMLVGDRLIGVLDVQADSVDHFTSSDVAIKTTLAAQIAIAVENARVLLETEQARKNVSRIYELSVDLIGTASHTTGKFVQLNPSWERILGFTLAELTAKPFIEFVHPDDVQPTLDEYARQMKEGRKSIAFDNRYLCKDGSYRWLSWNAVPVPDEGLTYFVVRDVTEERAATASLTRIYELSVDLIGTAKHSDQHFAQLNPAWASVLGWTLDELRAQPFITFVHPDDVQPTLDEYARQMKEGRKSIAFENRYRCKDGSYRWLAWNAVPVPAEGLTYFVVRDVTAEKATAAIVVRRAAELETVARVSAAATTELDQDKLLKTVADLTKDSFNLYHAHIYLYERDTETLTLAAGAGEAGDVMRQRGHNISYHRPNSLVARAARTLTGVISNDVTAEVDFLPNPLLPDTRSEMALPMIVGETLVGVLDVQADTFARFDQEDVRILTALASQVAVAVENARAVQQVLLHETAIQNSTSGMTIADMTQPDAPLIYINPAFEQITGYSVAEALGRNCRFLQNDDHDQPGLVELRAALKEGRGCTVVLRNYRKNGEMFYNELRMSPIRNTAGVITHYVGVQTDISERMNVELEREKLLKQAEEQAAVERTNAERLRQLDRMKSQFLANMSHELRTPLNSIIGYSEVLLDGDDGDLTEDAVEDVETIHSSGKHLLSIINDILDLAKIEAGEMRMDIRPTPVRPTIEECLRTAHILVKDKPVTLHFVEADAVPEVYADPIRLRQIMMNLISNAAKFTERGTVTVTLGRQDDDFAYVSVTDTGIGMTDDDQKVIFEQFRQVDGSSTRRAGGTGLGLTITRYLVQLQHGAIGVQSAVGEGSTFRFTIPLRAPVPEQG